MSAERTYMATSLQPDIYRTFAESEQANVLTRIYQETINIAIWERRLPETILRDLQVALNQGWTLNLRRQLQTQHIATDLAIMVGDFEQIPGFIYHIEELVEMFACLFDTPLVGLRLTTLDRAMCPRFHVDRVPCRLVSTLVGRGTEWLPHHLVDRSKLGPGSNGLKDEQSGLFPDPFSIQQLNCGDVALLKGELWEGNEGAGLVHRSPQVAAGETRLMLSLDLL